jgi:hypothetical protein
MRHKRASSLDEFSEALPDFTLKVSAGSSDRHVIERGQIPCEIASQRLSDCRRRFPASDDEVGSVLAIKQPEKTPHASFEVMKVEGSDTLVGIMDEENGPDRAFDPVDEERLRQRGHRSCPLSGFLLLAPPPVKNRYCENISHPRRPQCLSAPRAPPQIRINRAVSRSAGHGRDNDNHSARYSIADKAKEPQMAQRPGYSELTTGLNSARGLHPCHYGIKRLDGLVATFSDVIHPVDVKVATRTGEIMRSWRGGLLLHRFHDVLLCRDGAGPSIRMTLSLAFLCPALARTAIDGRPPRGFGVKRLMDLPMAWSDQWSALGLKDLAQATFSSALRIRNSA